MNDRLQRKLTYLRDRIVNAYWMVRQGRFRQVYDSLFMELQTRKGQVGAALAPAATPVELAGGHNPCKPAVPSPRPAISVAATPRAANEVELDQVASTLQDLLAGPEGSAP